MTAIPGRRALTIPFITLLLFSSATTSAESAAGAAPTEPVFGPPLDLSEPWNAVSPKEAKSVAVADLDGDGRDDVAVLMDPDYGIDANSYVNWYRQQPDGSLSPRIQVVILQSAGWHMIAADLITGGGEELLVMDATGFKVLSFVDGAMAVVGDLAISDPRFVEVGDLTGDSTPDMLLSRDSGLWLISDPLSADPISTQLTSPAPARDTALGDFTGDGLTDIAVAASQTAGAAPSGVMAGHGDGTFDPIVSLEPLTGGGTATAGDVDADGDADLAITGGWGTRVFRQSGGSLAGDTDTYLYGDPYWNWGGPQASLLMDLNDDGLLDIAVANVGTPNPYAVVHLQDEAGSFDTVFAFDMPQDFQHGYAALASGDLNGDGLTDFLEMVQRGAYAHIQLPPGSKAPTVMSMRGSNGDASTPNVLKGSVKLPNGGVAVDGTVDIQRVDPDGSSTSLQASMTDGYWELSDQTPVGGDFIYSASWAGDAVHEGSATDDITFTVARTPTSIYATLSRSRVLYGHPVEARFQLFDAPPGSVVELWLDAIDSTDLVLLGQYPAEPGQVTAFTFKPPASGTYVFTFDGSDWTAPTTSNTYLKVRADVSGKLLGGRRQGRYHVYTAPGKIYYVTEVRPPHPGSEATVEFEAKVGRWRFAGSVDVVLNADGVAGVVLRSSQLPPGVPFRVSTEFFKDDDHLPNTSKPEYFKVVTNRSPAVAQESLPAVDWTRAIGLS